MEGEATTVKKRYRLPVWLWWLAMPFFFMFTWIGISMAAHYGLTFLHPKLDLSKDAFYDHPILEYVIEWLFAPFVAVFGWSFFAPYHRIFAAMGAGVAYITPCWFCSWVDWESAYQKMPGTYLLLMVIGCVAPIVIYAILDREELKNVRI